MGDDEHRLPFRRKLHDNIQNLPHHLRIQRRGNLIKKHKFRMHGEGTDDGNSLLLSAGKHPGIGFLLIQKSYPFQKLSRLFFRLLLVPFLHLHHSQCNIFQNREMRKEFITLEYHAHFLPILKVRVFLPFFP